MPGIPRHTAAPARRAVETRSLVTWLLRTVVLVAGAVALSACDQPTDLDLTVTTAVDGSDALPGDGVCEMTPSAGDCSLRAAVHEANAQSAAVTIRLTPGTTYVLDAPGSDDDNGGGDLDLAPGGGFVRVIADAPGAAIDADGADGAIDARSGIVDLRGVAVTGADGAGVRVRSSTIVGLTAGSLHGNGGAGLRVDAGGVAALLSDTVSGNGAGGIANDGALYAVHATVSANTGGGIVGTGPVTLEASIVGAQTIGPDCTQRAVSADHNVDSDGTCDLDGDDDLSSTDPALAPLGTGVSPVHLPLPGSPVVDTIEPGAGRCAVPPTGATDQVGTERPQGGGCDRGAVEVVPLDLRVTTAADGADLAPGDGACTSSVGGCSLRAAVDEANASPALDRITIDPGIDPVITVTGTDEDANATGDFDVTDSLHVVGPGRTIDAAARDRVFDNHAGHLRIEGLTVTGGNPGFDAGGGVRNAADLTLDHATVSSNDAFDGGGVDHSNGMLLVLDSTIRANSGGSGDPFGSAPNRWGGGIRVASGQAHIERSTIDGNTAQFGGGLGVVGGEVTVAQSTLAENETITQVFICLPFCSWWSISNAGGAVHATGGDLRLTATTVVDNTTGLHAAGGAIEVAGTALQNTGADCVGSVTSLGYNADHDGGCGFDEPGDLSGVATLLQPFGDNGGPTATSQPGAGSPLIDAIPVGTPALCDELTPTDQRGATRPEGGACDIGSVEGSTGSPVEPLELTVDAAGDAGDATPGDGVCAGEGGCTLRAAIDEANAWPTADRVGIPTSVRPVLNAELVISDSTAIDGGGSVVTARFGIRLTGGTTTIADLAVTGSSDVAIRHEAGRLTLERSTLIRNEGGIQQIGGRLRVTDSTISDNFGPWAIGTSGPVETVVLRSTVVRNWAASGPNGGGGIAASPSGSFTIGGSVIDNLGNDRCSGSIDSLGYNLDPSGTCNLAGPGDLTGLDPLLGGAGPNGGLTPTALPHLGSPLVDAIPIGTPELCDASAPTDQRGVPRPDGGACDIGSVEGQAPVPLAPRSFVVDSALDLVDDDVGDGVCHAAGGVCTLRAALDEANSWPLADTITIAPGVDPSLTRTGTASTVDRAGDLDVTDSVTIVGNGATITQTRPDRVVHVEVAADLAMDDVTVTGGRGGHAGGGIFGDLYSGLLDLDEVHVAGNRADRGAGISWTGAVDIDASSFTGNEAEEDGGGLDLRTHPLPGGEPSRITASTIESNTAETGAGLASNGDLLIDRSTIAANVASLRGGGASVGSETANVQVVRSTVSGNRVTGVAGQGGGIVGIADVHIVASTVTANQAPAGGSGLHAWQLLDIVPTFTVAGSVVDNVLDDCLGIVVSEGYNQPGDATCGFDGATDLPVGDPQLAALADNGGPTATRLPIDGSPLIDAVPVATPVLCDGTLPTDQRGFPRPDGAGCDIGAAEGSTGGPLPLTLIVNHAGDARDASPGDGACQDLGGAPGACSLRAAVDEANAWFGDDTITIQADIDPELALSGGAEDANASGDVDLLDDVTIDGGGATVDANGLDRAFDVLGSDVELHALTLTGGSAGSSDGGAIRSVDAALALDDVAFTGNSAARGGALYVGSGTVTATDLDASGNSATGALEPGTDSAGHGGGAVYLLDGTLEVTGGELTGNSATRGGAVHVHAGTAALSGLHLATNTATRGGGAIFTQRAALTVDTSTFDENVAAGSSSGGGAIEQHRSSAPLPPPVVITGSSFTGNTATQFGGAVVGRLATITDSTFEENHARSGGGALSLDHDLALTSSTVANNTIERFSGAGVRSGAATIEGSTISGNEGGNSGGGIAATVLDLTGSTVVDNVVATGDGGGIALTGSGTSTIERSLIARNTTQSGIGTARGGGVYHATGTLNVLTSTLDDNGASGPLGSSGGGLHTGGSAIVVSSTITDNDAATGRGLAGGAGASIIVAGSVLDNNQVFPDTSNCAAPVTSGGWNVSTDATCGLAGAGDLASTPPLLGPLADNGGPTFTRLPDAASPVVDRIPIGTFGLCDGTLPTDQRGVARPLGTGCDVGAVER